MTQAMTQQALLDFYEPPPVAPTTTNLPVLSLDPPDFDGGLIFRAFRRDVAGAPAWFYFLPAAGDTAAVYTPVRVVLPRGWAIGEGLLSAGKHPVRCLLDADGQTATLTGAALRGRILILDGNF